MLRQCPVFATARLNLCSVILKVRVIALENAKHELAAAAFKNVFLSN